MAGEFLCEGPKLWAEAVKWGAEPRLLLTTEESLALEWEGRLAHAAWVAPELLSYASDAQTPQKLLFTCPIPAQPESPGERLLVLDGVQDPGNVGTVWRTADAFGADALILLPGCADPWSPKAVRATMGACFRLPVLNCTVEALCGLLAPAGLPLYAAALGEDAADVRRTDLRRAAVVIGSEGRGVSEAVLSRCAGTVRIPMRERCESLNAAMAAGIVLWESWRGDDRTWQR